MAEPVQNCEDHQYLDRTASNADRELTWEFGIENDAEHCLLVQIGQTVVWNGDLESHPLGASGGDSPNPIVLHRNGTVVFNVPGTFGYECLSHSSMIGAIKVVSAAPSPPSVPAFSSFLAEILAIFLMAGALLVIRSRARTMA